jgi:hypothetical protein
MVVCIELTAASGEKYDPGSGQTSSGTGSGAIYLALQNNEAFIVILQG